MTGDRERLSPLGDDESLPQRLSPAPRVVPLTLSVRAVLGGFMSQFGWAFLGFGMVFVWAFDAGAGVAELIRFSGEMATAEGTSTGWRGTGLRINEVEVYETAYVFDTVGGPVEGVSYESGGYVAEGEAVVVEYRASNPSISRIRGMRASRAGLMIVFVYLFPVVGAVFVIIGMRKGLKARHLMATGRLALGTLTSKEATNTRINEQPVYRLTFEFEAEGGGTYQAVAKTHLPEKLQDEARERLVYDPRNPSYAVLLDELPCRPRINRRGDFEASARDATLALLNLAIPGLTLLGHGAYLVILG